MQFWTLFNTVFNLGKPTKALEMVSTAMGKLRKVWGGGSSGKSVSERKRAFGGKQNLTFPQNFPYQSIGLSG